MKKLKKKKKIEMEEGKDAETHNIKNKELEQKIYLSFLHFPDGTEKIKRKKNGIYIYAFGDLKKKKNCRNAPFSPL